MDNSEQTCGNCNQSSDWVKGCDTHGWNGCTVCGSLCWKCKEVFCPWCEFKVCPMYYDRTKIDSEEEQALQDLSVSICDDTLTDLAFPWEDRLRRTSVRHIIELTSSDEEDPDGKLGRTQRARRESDHLYCRT